MLRFLVKRLRGRTTSTFAATLLAVICLNSPAWAGPILSAPIKSGGIVRYEDRGNHHRILGSGIRLGDLAFGGNILRLFRGSLSFSGGSFLHSDGGNMSWGPGGHLSLKGCADVNHDSKCDKGDLRGTLMTASFVDLELVDVNGKEVLEAKIVEHLNPELAALLGLKVTSQTGELDLMLTSLSNGKWWARDSVVSGSLTGQSVPEPGSWWLLGAGLLTLAMAVVGFGRARTTSS